MKIVCDACSAKYSIADEKVRGKVFKIRCKKCSNIIVVRGAVSEASETATARYDQKETKLLEYQGEQRADSAAEVSESAVWHLVIDQEQVGPMTVEEVRERFQRGEIDSEGYVWREGFGDWERLADVNEFSGIVAPARGDDGGMGVLFGSGGGEPYEDARAAHSDPGDLFAARGAGDDAGAATDLFSGTGLGPAGDGSGDTDALFSGDGGGGMGMAAGGGSGKPVVATLTAQRNENSVLFSLNNLAALASDAPRSVPMAAPSVAASSSSSSASMPAAGASAPTSEGSGLIDIRSMAQVYLGETTGGKPAARPVGSGSVDDLPVFSQSSFESASPVLLPTVQPAVNNRLLFALVGLIGLLVLAAVVLVVVVLKGGGEKPQLASADTAVPGGERSAAAAPAPAAVPAAAPAAGAAAAAPAGATPAAGTGEEPAAAGSNPPATEPPPAASGDSGGKSAARDEHEHGSHRDRDKKDRDRDRDRSDKKDRGRDRHSDRHADESRDRDPRPAAAPPPPDPTASSGCDEVTCLVEPDKPCCKKYARRSGSSGSRSASVDTSLPEQPSRSDVASGIGDVKGSVSSCGSRAPGGGKVTVKIKISPSGGVSSASASGGSPNLNSCVESAVKRAHFPRSQFGVSVNYPFIF
ncbi:MAG TPA: GYF domain-containing protein [Kofleriaceae bacterium]|nr:GYF domain-containing protein [Kofleriaceae bacterium]